MGVGRVLKAIGKGVAFPVVAPVRLVQRGVEKTMLAAILGVVRHGLTTVGGGLVAAGWTSAEELSVAVGAAATLVGFGWSVWQKRADAAKK